MSDYRGLLIKKQRKELDISLEALSHGVCSPSYLSKIENNILVANDDIYNLLFKKLGISTMDTIKEEKIKQMLDLFFKYYMSSDSKIFKVMDELLEYKDEVVSSCLFVQYQLFLLYASEMNSQINISLAEVEAYYSYMDDSQREYFNLFRLSSGNMELSDNEEWVFIRRLKAKANLYAYQKNTFAAYDLYKTCLNYAIEQYLHPGSIEEIYKFFSDKKKALQFLEKYRLVDIYREQYSDPLDMLHDCLNSFQKNALLYQFYKFNKSLKEEIRLGNKYKQ